MRKVFLAACLLMCILYPFQAHAKCGWAVLVKWIDVGSSAAGNGIQIELHTASFRAHEPDVYGIAVKFRGEQLTKKGLILRQNQMAHFRPISGCKGELVVQPIDRDNWANRVEFGAILDSGAKRNALKRSAP
jgi:hypothetical protein